MSSACGVSLQVVYFTALFPYVVMAIFLVRALFLSGFYHGLLYLFWPKVSIVSAESLICTYPQQLPQLGRNLILDSSRQNSPSLPPRLNGSSPSRPEQCETVSSVGGAQIQQYLNNRCACLQ